MFQPKWKIYNFVLLADRIMDFCPVISFCHVSLGLRGSRKSQFSRYNQTELVSRLQVY